ncbi:MAG: segregation/condensation protein A [Nitrospira sp.]|nr:segregation/condensation protein A [bacterium]MBL7049664.1 segregation/condensation protein A [Nitrospira sp.]
MPNLLENKLLTVQPGESGKDSEVTPADNHALQTSFQFTHPVFEGPLDLLLHLIREHKIDLYDIPILQITRQYMEYLELMKEMNLETAGEFLVMAATLIQIKSRMLLPKEIDAVEDAEGDPRAELVQRLIEYQAYKESTEQFRKREDIWKNIFFRSVPEKEDLDLGPEPVLFEANVYDLINAFQKLLAKAPEQVREITREILTVKDRINYIVEKLENEDGVRFEDLFERDCTRLIIIVTFLALLETIRLGLATVYQEDAFGNIWLLNPNGRKAGEVQGDISLTEELQEVCV